MGKKKRSASERKRSAEWWAKLSPETRAKMKREQEARGLIDTPMYRRSIESPPTFQHHRRDDLACPACGTDSSVGCLEKAP